MSEKRKRDNRVRRNAWILLTLTGLFVFRVVAQLIQAWHPVGLLPSFEVWQSGALPYSILVISQVAILWVCMRIVWRMFKGVVTAVPTKGRILLYLGGLYLVVMSIRLTMGLTVASDHFWFGAVLPTIFHCVLATFMLVYGWYHVSDSYPLKPIPHEANV